MSKRLDSFHLPSELVKSVCNKFGFTETARRTNSLILIIEYSLLIRDVEKDIEFIIHTFLQETRTHHFAHIPPKKTEMFTSASKDWEQIWKKFPSTEAPARAAVEAYAVGLNEASVYHMMMVLEPGLKTLAQRMKVKYDRQTWDTIIGKIEDEIRGMVSTRGHTPKGSKPPSPAATSRLRADITLFTTAATEFIWFKEAWRNHVAHGRAQYDENDALKVITHVRGFMERLSTRLRERYR